MASPPKEGKLTAETTKPPLAPSAFVSRKSESFRRVPYAPPGEVNPVETQQEETTTGIGSFIRRMWSGSDSLPAHMSSDSVVDEILRRNSGSGQRNEGELPPKPSRRSSSPPSPPKTVGLPSVTLVATETPPSKETETLEMNAEVSDPTATAHQQSSIQKENVSEKKKEGKQTLASGKGEEDVDTDTAHEENEKERTGFETPITPEELPVVVGSSVTVEAAGKERSVEGEKPVAIGTSGVAETPKPPVLDTQSPPTAPTPTESIEKSSTAEKGTGAMEGSKVNVSAPVKKPEMRKAETMPKPSQQPGLFLKILSFGRAGAVSKPIAKEEEEELAKQTEAIVVEEKIPDEEPAKLSESSTLADDPSGSRMPPATPDQAAANIARDKMDKKTETSHDRMSSELTATELDALKSSFMSEMRNKGIDVEGKYTKSSVDFDSPLMFLLDLHTFAVTQHSSVRMEDVLEEKYGAAHKVVTEFSAATARQRESHIQQLSSEQEKTVLSSDQQRQEETKGTTPSASKSTGEVAESNKLVEVVSNDRAPSEELIEETFVSHPPVAAEKDVASPKVSEIPPSGENVPTQKTYEEALDTAQDAVKDAKEETQGGHGGDGGDGGGSSSESQAENKKPQSAVKGTEKAKSKPSSDALPPRAVLTNSSPERPPSHDPTPSSPIPPRCFMCCFYPRAD